MKRATSEAKKRTSLKTLHLARIPEEWEVVRLGEVGEIITDGKD